MISKDCLIKFVIQIEVLVKECTSSWCCGGDIFTNGNFLYRRKLCALFLELFLHLLVLNGLHLKIIHMPKRRILRWYILVSVIHIKYPINISTFCYFLVDYMQKFCIQQQSKRSSLNFKYYSCARRKRKGISEKLMSLASKSCQSLALYCLSQVFLNFQILKINIQIKRHIILSLPETLVIQLKLKRYSQKSDISNQIYAGNSEDNEPIANEQVHLHNYCVEKVVLWRYIILWHYLSMGNYIAMK